MIFWVGILFGILVVGVGAVVVHILIGPDPPAEPPPQLIPENNHNRRSRLLQPNRWKRAQHLQGDTRPQLMPGFDRPLEIQPLPEQAILPPPREIQGMNHEE